MSSFFYASICLTRWTRSWKKTETVLNSTAANAMSLKSGDMFMQWNLPDEAMEIDQDANVVSKAVKSVRFSLFNTVEYFDREEDKDCRSPYWMYVAARRINFMKKMEKIISPILDANHRKNVAKLHFQRSVEEKVDNV